MKKKKTFKEYLIENNIQLINEDNYKDMYHWMCIGNKIKTKDFEDAFIKLIEQNKKPNKIHIETCTMFYLVYINGNSERYVKYRVKDFGFTNLTNDGFMKNSERYVEYRVEELKQKIEGEI